MLKSNQELECKIRRELPIGSFSSNATLLNAIRVWCYENVPYALEHVNLQDQILKDGKYVYYDIWLHKQLYEIYNDFDKKGFWCGGHAQFLSSVYQLFGYTSQTVNFGYPSKNATHVVTIVDFNHGFYIQDCYLNAVSLNSYEDINKIVNQYGKCGIKSIYYIMYENNHKNVKFSTINPVDYQSGLLAYMTQLVFDATGINDIRAIFLQKI